jgi:Xaa-Pro aminopeptidase
MTDTLHRQQQRTRLMEAMGEGVAVISTAPGVVRNGDSHYPYRFDSHFYYLTGFAETEAVLVLVAGDEPRSILFCRDKDAEREIWDGFRYGPEGAREMFGFDEAHPVAALDELMPTLLADQARLYFAFGADVHWDARVMQWLDAVRSKARSGVAAPAAIHDVRVLLDEMRLIKSEHELASMRRAAAISTCAHIRAMRAVRPGLAEYQIEAELLHEFRSHGSQSPAYASIVAGGANACVLHYSANNAMLHDGDLLLIDAGCEMDGYASDITRTFPVNGRFGPAQKDLYQLVLAAQAAALDKIGPGCCWNEPHDAAVAVLARGFVDFGMCEGSVESVIESGDYRRFYMHRTGHWLGMDVHDVGSYKQAGEWRPLVPGMVLTVEPGCYVRPADNVPRHFWNIGIRIEDDVLVTQTGHEILTAAAPNTVDAIESLMAGR